MELDFSLEKLAVIAIIAVGLTPVITAESSAATAEDYGDYLDQDPTFLHRSKDNLLIGSFSLDRFGKAKVADLNILMLLVKIIMRYDVLTVTDIYDKSGMAVRALLAAINQESLHPYAVKIGEPLGRSPYKEQLGIFYRISMLEITDSANYEDIADKFERPPMVAVARFINNKQSPPVAFVTVHTTPLDAVVEMDAMVEVTAWVKTKFQASNVVISGSFNAMHPYAPQRSWSTMRLWTDNTHKWLFGTGSTRCPWCKNFLSMATSTREYNTTGCPTCKDTEFTSAEQNVGAKCPYCSSYIWITRNYERKPSGSAKCLWCQCLCNTVVGGDWLRKRIYPGSPRIFRFDNAFRLSESEAVQVSNQYPVEFILQTGDNA